MLKHILFYAPSRIIPAILSLLSVAVFTRLMTVEDYGYFALAAASLAALQAFLNQWLGQGILRYYTATTATPESERLLAACGVLFWITSLGTMAVGTAILAGVMEPGVLRSTLLLTLPQYVLFALVNLVLRLHMSRIASKRYTALQVAQTVTSTGSALALVAFVAPRPELAIAGLTLGYIIMLAMDWRFARKFILPEATGRDEIMKLVRFGWPVAIAGIMGFVLGRSDRFILQHLLGPEAVGIYSASFSLAEQAIASLFMIIIMVSHPMAIRALESKSAEQVDRQLRTNAVWVMGLGLPGAVGFALVAQEMSQLFLGQAFRADALQLIPWVAAGTFLTCFKAHYLDHAFTMASKNHYLVYTMIPTAIVSTSMNFLLIPRFGLMGAAYASVAAYAFGLALTWVMSRRVFKMPLPWLEFAKIAVATGVMAVVLLELPARTPVVGLIEKLAFGSISYAAIALALNVNGTRSIIAKRLL